MDAIFARRQFIPLNKDVLAEFYGCVFVGARSPRKRLPFGVFSSGCQTIRYEFTPYFSALNPRPAVDDGYVGVNSQSLHDTGFQAFADFLFLGESG